MSRSLVITSIKRPSPSSYFSDSEQGMLDWETLMWRFAAQHSYWVATQGSVPHSMPVWGIWQDCAFRFSTHPESRKAKNLRQHPVATVHLGDTEAVVVLQCSAVELTDASELQHFVNDYNPKYKWNFSADDVRLGTFALTPYKAFAWADGQGEGFTDTATRWTFAVA